MVWENLDRNPNNTNTYTITFTFKAGVTIKGTSKDMAKV